MTVTAHGRRPWRAALARHLVLSLLLAALATSVPSAQEGSDGSEMAEAIKKAAMYTQPGKHHKLLEKFIGTWDMELKMTMEGMDVPPSKGTSETKWLYDGRWIKTRQKGTLLGMPIDTTYLMGYDNFKQSYVSTWVSTMDTALPRVEGDLDPRGNVLIFYGTIDEYLTGEHDKMVKSIFRFVSDDKIIQEIHDLPIGEHNTQVLELVFTRKGTEG